MARGVRLQGMVTAGRWTLPAVIFVCTICWFATSFITSIDYERSVNYAPLGMLSDILHGIPLWLNKLAGYVLYASMGYFLIEFNNVYNIIRMRASVQTSLYFLLITACPAMHLLYPGDIASAGFLVSLYFLFRSYHKGRASSDIFFAFVFLSIGTLFFPQMVYFAPLWWIGLIKFQSLSARSLCASILGFSLPYWFLFGHAFFYQKMELFYQPFIEMANLRPIDYRSQLPLWEMVTLGYLFISTLASTVHYAMKGYQDKIQTRSYLDFLLVLCYYTFVFMFLQPGDRKSVV